MRPSLLALLRSALPILAAGPLFTGLARAEDAGSRATARSLAQEGKDAFDRKDYATAEERFTRAGALVHAPTLLVFLARAEVGLGKLVAAAENYRRVLREEVPAG